MASPGEALKWGQEREKWGISGLGWLDALGESSHSGPTALHLLRAAPGSRCE